MQFPLLLKATLAVSTHFLSKAFSLSQELVSVLGLTKLNYVKGHAMKSLPASLPFLVGILFVTTVVALVIQVIWKKMKETYFTAKATAATNQKWLKYNALYQS